MDLYKIFNGCLIIFAFFLGLAITFKIKHNRKEKNLEVSQSNTENLVSYVILALTLIVIMWIIFNPKDRTRGMFAGISFALALAIGSIVGVHIALILSTETLEKWIIASFCITGIALIGVVICVVKQPEMFSLSEPTLVQEELVDIINVNDDKEYDDKEDVLKEDVLKEDVDLSVIDSPTEIEDISNVINTPNTSRMEYKTLWEQRKETLKKDRFESCMIGVFGPVHYGIDYDSITISDLKLVKKLCQQGINKMQLENMDWKKFTVLLNQVMEEAVDKSIWYNLLMAKYIDSDEDMFSIQSIKIPAKHFKYIYKTYPHLKEKLEEFLTDMKDEMGQ